MSEVSENSPHVLLESLKGNSPYNELQFEIGVLIYGKNYLQRTKLVRLALKEKQKLGHLIEDLPSHDDEI